MAAVRCCFWQRRFGNPVIAAGRFSPGADSGYDRLCLAAGWRPRSPLGLFRSRMVVRVRIFAFGLYWIGNALLVFGEKHAWMLPIATVGLPGFLALFTAVASRAGFARGRIALIFAVVASFSTADWLRGHVLTGLLGTFSDMPGAA